MNIFTHRNFDKKYAKLPEKLRERFKERRNIFVENPFHPLLDNHPLTAEWAGCWSINVTGSYRAIYRHEQNSTVRFLAIGTHSELYGK